MSSGPGQTITEWIAGAYEPGKIDSLDKMLEEEWVTFRVVSGPVTTVKAAPGNGTEYRFILVPVTPAMADWMGLNPEGYMLALEPAGLFKGTMSVKNPRASHPEYIKQKLGMNDSDAVAMSLILDRVGEAMEKHPTRPYDEEIHVFMDGNAWTANRAKGYTDMMACPTGFGDTPQDAVTSLLSEEEKR